MTEDECIRVVGLQTGEHRLEGKFLCRGSGVVITTIYIQSPFVADADAVGVVVSGMGTGYILTPTGVDVSVAGDVIMVADTIIATASVARIEVLYGVRSGSCSFA